jgi:predicted RecB family nuclease
MQDFGGGKLVFSASDLAVASECMWAQVRRVDKALGHDISVPKDDDAMLVRAGSLGDRHEAEKLKEFKIKFGDGVAEIARPDYDDKTKSIEEQMLELSAQTLQALADKKKVVFQATFFDGEFQGFADFLVLTDEGEYAVYDTKLARKAKITALIQLAAYADQLQKNGVPTSKQVHLILGDQSVSTHQLEDILPTYLKRRADMQKLVDSRRANKLAGGAAVVWNDGTYSACGRCVVCEPHVEATDDLLLVAGMRLEQRAKLRAAGIETVKQLAESTLAKVKNMTDNTFINLRSQAWIQIQTNHKPAGSPPVYEVVDAPALAALPKPHPGDIFFDFEGDPLYQESDKWNLDYLFGYVDDEAKFEPIWAHNLAGEKAALIKFTDMLKARLAANPGMHVYHYAAYEKTHLLSLAARHGVAEDFIDDLLRKNILVDLYPIVRRAVLVGSHSYSLKKLEPIFVTEDERKGVANAAESVVEYANYCELVAAHKLDEAKEKLADIEQYNAYDCRSTLALRNWLRDLASEHGVELKGSPEMDVPEDSDDPTDPLFIQLMALIEGVDDADRTPDQTAVALAAAAIDFHRREKKSFWWAHFERLVAPVEDWQDTRDVFIVDHAEVSESWHINKGQRNERRHLKLFTTPAPGSKLTLNAQVYLVYPNWCESLPEPSSPGARRIVSAKVIEIVSDSVFLVEEMLAKGCVEHDYLPLAVTPGAPPKTTNIENAIKAWGENVLATYPTLERQPALDVLRRQAPLGREFDQIEGEDSVERITQALLAMPTGTLAVQGPPGAGKSFNGGHVIAELVQTHKWKIGVVSQGHSTVENLLRAISKAGLPKHLAGKAIRTGTTVGEVAESANTTWTPFVNTEYGSFMAQNPEGFVVGGTVYEFVKTANFVPGELDLLVIDEAGQFSLANTIAASTAAKRLLLLGDPQQLPQVTQGTHPEPIDGSALGWLADGHEVLPAEFGFFLPSSWRMNDQVCQVISDNYYDSKLNSAAPPRTLQGVEPGFFPIPVKHNSNSTESVEEAERVVQLVAGLVDKTWTDETGSGPLSEAKENIIVVAPYNAQVQLIRTKLDAAGFKQIPVGTVDKFQGQEAAVAIVSMTASSAMDVPRGVEFLFMPNRLNVAISRAKWAAYLIYSPALLDYRPTNVDNLRLNSKFLNLINVRG